MRLCVRTPPPHPLQVRHAEAAGASAAIVYDDVYEALIIMSKPRDNPEPGIPAVFVSEKAGVIMRRLVVPGQTRVRLEPVRWLAAHSICVCLCVCVRACCTWLQQQQHRQERACCCLSCAFLLPFLPAAVRAQVSASAWVGLLLSGLLGFLALAVVMATFWVMRSWSEWLGRTRRRAGGGGDGVGALHHAGQGQVRGWRSHWGVLCVM